MYGDISEVARLCWIAWHRANSGEDPPFELTDAPGIESPWVNCWMHMENYVESLEGRPFDEIAMICEAAFANYSEREPLWEQLGAREKLAWEVSFRMFHNLFQLDPSDRVMDHSPAPLIDALGRPYKHASSSYDGENTDVAIERMLDNAKDWVDQKLGVSRNGNNKKPRRSAGSPVDRSNTNSELRQPDPPKRKRGRPKGSKDTRKRRVRKSTR